MKMRMLLPLLSASMLGLLAMPQTAAAQGNAWSVHNAGSCKVIVNGSNLYGFGDEAAISRVTWSGGCVGGVASGLGVMIVYFREGTSVVYADYHGMFANGLMQGAWRQASYEKIEGYSGKTGPGDPSYIGSGIANDLTLSDGCLLKFENEPVKSGCNMVTGRALARATIAIAPPAPSHGFGSRRIPQGEGARVSQ